MVVLRTRRYARWVVRGLLSELWSNVGPSRRFAGPPVASRGAPGWAVVTGGTGAIGEAVCRGLAARGYDVVVGARDAAKGAAVADAVARDFGVRSRAAVGDVRDAATFAGGDAAPVLLVNNAGVMGVARDETLRVNLFAPAGTAFALLDGNPDLRVVNVCSSSHLRAGAVRGDRLEDAGVDGSLEAYAESKLGLMQHTAALRRSGVDARACHPGLVWTPMMRGFFGPRLCAFLGPVHRRLFRTPEQGAATVLAAALEESLEDADGDLIYFVDGRLAPRAASPEARTQELPPDVAALLRRGVS